MTKRRLRGCTQLLNSPIPSLRGQAITWVIAWEVGVDWEVWESSCPRGAWDSFKKCQEAGGGCDYLDHGLQLVCGRKDTTKIKSPDRDEDWCELRISRV